MPSQQAAGGHDVFAAGGTDGAGDAMVIEVVAKLVHRLRRGGAIGGVGRGMETDEVHSTMEPLQQAYQFGSMTGGVVEPGKHGVFERDAPLAAPIILFEQGNHVGNGIGSLHGHDGEPFLREGVVETYGKVALASVQETFQPGDDADRGDGNAVGAPTETPIGGKDIRAMQNAGKVVHRFAHAHVYDIGKLAKFGDGEYLIEDIGGREVAMEALLPSDAKTAAHLAAHLTGDAEGGARRTSAGIQFRDVDGLDVLF